MSFFASNCLERLRAIKRIRKRLTYILNQQGAAPGKDYGICNEPVTDGSEKIFVIEDFTDYV